MPININWLLLEKKNEDKMIKYDVKTLLSKK